MSNPTHIFGFGTRKTAPELQQKYSKLSKTTKCVRSVRQSLFQLKTEYKPIHTFTHAYSRKHAFKTASGAIRLHSSKPPHNHTHTHTHTMLTHLTGYMLTQHTHTHNAHGALVGD